LLSVGDAVSSAGLSNTVLSWLRRSLLAIMIRS